MSTEVAPDYADIPEADRKKAQTFFDRGSSVASTGNFDYAIEMYLSGLMIDPENVEAHQTLRAISLKRKASGGKPIGMFAKMKLGKPKDDRERLNQAEKLLAYDPGDATQMAAVLEAARSGGFYDTLLWIGGELTRALRSAPKPDFAKWVQLKDGYKQVGEYKLASEAAAEALQIRADDVDLQHEVKSLAAQETMKAGKYGEGKSFRDSIRDRDKQEKLLRQDADVRVGSAMDDRIAEAEAAYAANPEDPALLTKLVDLLTKSEVTENEARAGGLLGEAYERTKQFRYRFGQTRIRMAQLAREERDLRARVAKSAGDNDLREQYRAFRRSRAEEELTELQLAAQNYPTDMSLKFQVGQRLFLLEQYDEAIPVFQQAMNDPKHRADATTLLGQSFLAAGYVDEAVETLRGQIERHASKGDDKSKEMVYWYARALEKQKDTAAAAKAYSQVAQWDFNYRDVQTRIKSLRTVASET